MTALAPILEAHFTERLAQQQVSPHTVASYREAFCLLLRYMKHTTGTEPADLDAGTIGEFLLEGL